jgi:hypothetical protein
MSPRIATLAMLVSLALAGCWYTTLPQDGHLECRTNTYGFLIFHTSTTTCETVSSSPTPTAAPTAAP